MLVWFGGVDFVLACTGTAVVLIAKLLSHIQVPGYTPIILASLFFGALTSVDLGIVGRPQWLTLQNTRGSESSREPAAGFND